MGIHSVASREANRHQGATCSCSAPIAILSVRTEARCTTLHGVCSMCGSRAVIAITAAIRRPPPQRLAGKAPLPPRRKRRFL